MHERWVTASPDGGAVIVVRATNQDDWWRREWPRVQSALDAARLRYRRPACRLARGVVAVVEVEPTGKRRQAREVVRRVLDRMKKGVAV